MVVAVGKGMSVSATTASDIAERRKNDTITLAFIAPVSGDTTREIVSTERSSAMRTSNEDKQVKIKIGNIQHVSNPGEFQSKVRH